MVASSPGLADELELPAFVSAALERLHAGAAPAFLVGGAVRDLLLGKAARDFDLLVPAGLTRAAEILPDARRVDAQIPMLLLRGDGVSLEITGLRSGAACVEQDLRLRDFTLNAIALNAIGVAAGSRRLIDPVGGRADLSARRLRAADPARCFRDDPVRILRGARLECELALALDPDTERVMERDAPRLGRAPGERLRDELFRLLALPDPTPGLERLRRVGALAAALPELLRGIGVDQNRHHPDDVYDHTLRVCALVPPRPLLRLAALLHDAAKPDTKTFRATQDDGEKARGDFRFLRHEHAAVRHVDSAARRLRLSRRDTDHVTRLVRHHLVYPDRLTTGAARRRLVRRVGRDILDDLLVLRRADLGSREADGSPGAAWDEVEMSVRNEAGSEEPTRLAITGKMIMREFDLEEGPLVGRLLQRARRRATEDPAHNTPQALLAWLRASRSAEER